NALAFPPGTVVRDEALRTRHGAGPDTVVLLCAGMFRPEKNQSALLSIAARLPASPDWQLWFAGAGPAETACREHCARAGLENRVRFLGFQTDPAPLYRAADMAVLTSRSEALSNFLIEAQAHGLPAVAYAATGVAECLADGRSGRVVAMDDADGFLTALTPLITNAETRARFGAAVRDCGLRVFVPAVAYAATGVPECLADGRSGRVVAMVDADGFLTALTPLITNAETRARFGAEARDFARTAFDPAARARDYLALFARLNPDRA